MAQTPVAKFMAQDRHDLLGLALLDQSVIDDDMLLPRQAEEVGVGVRAALAAVNDKHFVQRELESLREGLHFGFQLALLEGREFVE